MLEWLKDHYELIRALLPAVLVAGILSIVGLAIRNAQTTTNGKIEGVQQAQHLSLIEGCERLQVLRAQDNEAHYADFLVDSIVLARFPHLDGLTPTLHRALQLLTWVPRTDCRKAVNQRGFKYRAPQPIKFTVALPTASSLQP